MRWNSEPDGLDLFRCREPNQLATDFGFVIDGIAFGSMLLLLLRVLAIMVSPRHFYRVQRLSLNLLIRSPAARRRQQKRAYGEGSQKPRPSSQPLEAFVPSKEVFARRVSYSKVILETTNEEQPDKPIASVRRSSVTVLPLNRVVPLHEADETQESVGAQKMGDGPIAGRRGSIMLDSRPRAMSFDPTSGRRPSISSIQLQPTVLSSRRGSLVPSNQPSTGNGVVVTYLPRRGSIAQTNQP